MRIMVCIAHGKPVAVFTDLDAGDRWLAENASEVDLVFLLEDGQPTSNPIVQPLSAYLTQRLRLNGHVPRVTERRRPAT